MNIKTETWNGHDIRFVEKEAEWLAVAKDVSSALGYSDSHAMTRHLDQEEISSFNWKEKQYVNLTVYFSDYKFNPTVSIISETGIYEAIFNSQREEAKEFKKWVKSLLKSIRQASGLEAFQIFRMVDKEHQKEAMGQLNRHLNKPKIPDFIKANTIANKAISSKFGHPKMLKKEQMTPQMLVERQNILDETVTLMTVVDNYGLELSISEKIYSKYIH